MSPARSIITFKGGQPLTNLIFQSELLRSYLRFCTSEKSGVKLFKEELPFSVRLRNESLRLRNLLNPPLLESSLLGEPGIMLV